MVVLVEVVGGSVPVVLVVLVVLLVLVVGGAVLVVVVAGSTSSWNRLFTLHTPPSRTRTSMSTHPATIGVHRVGLVVLDTGAIHSTASGTRSVVSSARRTQARRSDATPTLSG